MTETTAPTLTAALAAFRATQTAERGAVNPVRALAAADRLAAVVETLADALDELADVFGDGMTADHIGGHFTCTEAERVADVLRLAGQDKAAETWLDGHSEHDDDADDGAGHIERKVRVQAAYEAFRAEWADVDAARRILSNAARLTAPHIYADKHPDRADVVRVHATAGDDSFGRTPAARIGYAAELLAAHRWTVERVGEELAATPPAAPRA